MSTVKRRLQVSLKQEGKPKHSTSHFNGVGFFWDKNIKGSRCVVHTETATVEDVFNAYRRLGQVIRIALRDHIKTRAKRWRMRWRIWREGRRFYGRI